MIDEVIGPGLIIPMDVCYVNAFMQLLFHILPLRLLIFAWINQDLMISALHLVFISMSQDRLINAVSLSTVCEPDFFIAEIASKWACRYSGHSVILLREDLGTQLNNCSLSGRSLDCLPLSPLYLFPIDIHSSDAFPFPDPLLGSNAWILASGWFSLMLNHLKHSKMSFVHFAGSSS
jgi:hypothetical protein